MSDQLLPIPWLDVLLLVALIALNGALAMGELAIVSSREARLKAMLLQRLSELGIEFKDLNTRQSSLEDIFLSLVSERK